MDILADDIKCRLNVIGYDFSSDTDTIARVLAKLPADIRDWVLDKIYFYCPPLCNSHAPTFMLDEISINDLHETVNGLQKYCIRIVYLEFTVFEKPEKEQHRIIAREIAHHWLKHSDPLFSEETLQRKAEADNLVHEWGFSDRP
jgi:hypothetical protein